MARTPEVKVKWDEHPDAEASIRVVGRRARAIISSNDQHGKLPSTVAGKEIDWSRGRNQWQNATEGQPARRIIVARVKTK